MPAEGQGRWVGGERLSWAVASWAPLRKCWEVTALTDSGELRRVAFAERSLGSPGEARQGREGEARGRWELWRVEAWSGRTPMVKSEWEGLEEMWPEIRGRQRVCWAVVRKVSCHRAEQSRSRSWSWGMKAEIWDRRAGRNSPARVKG